MVRNVGSSASSSSVKSRQPNVRSAASCTAGSYSPASSSLATRSARTCGITCATMPSNRPTASGWASWNRLLTHGSRYGVKGMVDAYTLEQPVELAMTTGAGPLPVGPPSYRYWRCSSCSIAPVIRSIRARAAGSTAPSSAPASSASSVECRLSSTSSSSRRCERRLSSPTAWLRAVTRRIAVTSPQPRHAP